MIQVKPSATADTRGPLRVGHRIIVPGSRLDDLPARLDGARWDMVELDVLADAGGRLVVAHDRTDLARPELIDFADALRALARLLPDHVGVNVDIKATGYELRVAEEIAQAGLPTRTLISTMELSSLAILRRDTPSLRLGLSVPRARRNYLANPLTRYPAYGLIAFVRQTLPGRIEPLLADRSIDAVMACWGVITPTLVEVVRRHDAELYAWTVDDHERLSALHRLGVTGVITNDQLLFSRAGLDPLPAV